jgi:hypothetical protein
MYRTKDTYTFFDSYNKQTVLVHAYDLTQAWEKFANWARGQYGMKKTSSLDEVKAHFEGYLTVKTPDDTYEIE